jgi:hypothetical protein
MRKSIGRVAVVVAVLAAFLAIPGVALAHHSSIEFNPGCLEADGSFDFDYTITAATDIGTEPEDMQNPAVEVWISYDGGTPFLDQTGAFVWDGTDGVYPSFTGSGTADADTVTVTIEADPVAEWSDGTPPLGDSREATFNAPTEQCPTEDGEIIVRKVTNPASEEAFDFTASWLDGGFSLSDGGSRASGPLDPGTYAVSEIVPEGWSLTSAVCDDESAPGEIGLQAGETVTCTFTNSEDGPPPPPPPSPPVTGAIGDLVWEDLNADGHQGDFEPGVVGVTVNLLNSGGLIAATTVTDASGNYLFSGLAAGTYEVQFIPPAGFQVSPLRAAGAAVDSDAGVGFRTGAITLASGQVDLTWDAGIFKSEVLPQVITATTSTTAASVTVETLPFTGSSGTGAAGLGVALLALGGLLVLMTRSREDEAVLPASH